MFHRKGDKQELGGFPLCEISSNYQINLIIFLYMYVFA